MVSHDITMSRTRSTSYEKYPLYWEAFLVKVSNELDLSVEQYMDMVETSSSLYTTVDRADTLVPLFCQSSAPVCSQDVVTPDHSLLTVLG